MRYLRGIVALAAGIAAIAVAPRAGAVDFEPFKDVENVCPDCEEAKSDEIETTGGETIRCDIVAANEDFWVLERYGQIRAIPDSKVASHSFADGSPPSDLRSQDQIVLETGHVLTGTIVDDSDEPSYFEIKSSVGGNSFVVFKSEAKALYREGSKATIETDENGDESGK